ncbi:N-acetylmuramoyl-L-alanine amidase [Saccharibacillus sp. O23]|uniref:N-acetylmuramoyl-L-alanine amidase family protein n=1 Tax=Saccharibacillus sp. O23 TaxID=2009338 RepID=UPI000B4E02AB|nr:N-acetylmuramoyl-L-alanine amidase family protein [Saccharibacillus sp. O23]OWR30012.1 N-acetylmuramoyl-L-alanine amidase [Saccharibacillus sp. O23]
MKLASTIWKKNLFVAAALTLMTLLLLNGGIRQAWAAPTSGTSIVLDGKSLDGAESLVRQGTTMVPIRVISEQLGYAVNWQKSTGHVTIGSEPSQIVLTIGSLNADSPLGSISLTQAPFIQSNTTYVPLRFVGTQMGLGVKWEQASQTVLLQSPIEAPPVPPAPEAPPAVDNPAAISIDSISFSDKRLTISAGADVTPTRFELNNPDRLVVDLPGTVFGPALLQNEALARGAEAKLAVENSSLVKQVRYSQFSQNPSIVRVVIDLNRKTGYNLYTQGNLIIVDLNNDGTAAPIDSNGKKTVVIDPGHGDHDSGGVGISKIQEKNIVLNVGLKVAALLKQEPNINLIMTRSDDTFVTLTDRAKIANDAKADLFLSIHANISPSSSSAGGTETFYAEASRSKALSDVIQKHVLAATGFKDRGSKQANYSVIRNTKMPAALVELGFLSNLNEETLLNQDDFQQKIAEAIVAGIKEYLNL